MIRTCYSRAHALPTAMLALLLALASAGLASGAARTSGSDQRRERPGAPAPAGVFQIVRTTNADALAQCLVGPGFLVTGASLTGADVASGAFSGGAGVVGLDAGVVLSTGDVDSLARPNMFDDMSGANFTPGDASLDAVLDPTSAVVTYDAAVLEIDFTAASPGALSLSFVFGSEEYNEFVDDQFNDLFAIFLDGNDPSNNIALTGGACASDLGLTIAINSVNCGSDGNNMAAPNCNCYRDNTGATIEIELDGLTQTFTASAAIAAGSHHLKIAIADAADEIYDAAVFIKCQSGGVPVRPSTWGSIKARYR